MIRCSSTKFIVTIFSCLVISFGITPFSHAYTQSRVYDSLYFRAQNFTHINTDSVRYYLNQALLIAEESNNPNNSVKTLLELAINDTKSGDYTNCITYCSKAFEIASIHNLKSERINILKTTGSIYQTQGLTYEALNLYLEAIQLNKSSNDSKGAVLYYCLASAYEDLGEIEKCIDYAKTSLQLAKQFKNVQDEFNAYSLLANTQTKVDSIRKYLNLSKEIINQNPNLHYEKVTIFNNLAIFEKALGDYEKSSDLYSEAIKIAKTNQFNIFLSKIYNNYAYLLMAQEKYDSAKIVLEKALKYASNKNKLNLEGSIYDSYSDYYYKINDFEKAFQYQDTSTSKKNQYRSQQQIQRSLFLTAVFETEKKEMEIVEKENKLNHTKSILFASISLLVALIAVAIYYFQKSSHNKTKLLNTQNEKELEIANALIEGQDNERKRLAQDLHDGISSQIGTLRFVIDSNMQNEGFYHDLITSIDKIHNDIRSISHRMLPPQVEEVGLIPSLNNMFASLRVNNNIVFNIISNIESPLDPKLELNIYYLIYEMINNAIKHSKCTHITAQLFKDKEIIRLTVEDDGIGFEETKVKHGLGLRNIKYRVEHLNGKLMIDSEINFGSTFLIEIPEICNND